MFEEQIANDTQRAKQVYEDALKLVPHKEFTFAKLWILYAQFQVRQKDIRQARLVFGNSIGKCPRTKVLKAYADLEMQLGEVQRCRTIYEKQVDIFQSDSEAWVMYAEFEGALGELERARAIFEIAIGGGESQGLVLDMPEKVWKAYIDFEVENHEIGRARSLYSRLLDKTKHVKVWASYAKFEAEQANRIKRARNLMEEAQTYFRKEEPELKEERRMLLETWLSIEQAIDEESEMVETVKAKLPKLVKKRRKTKVVDAQTGEEVMKSADPSAKENQDGWEEYEAYVFPEDEKTNGK